MGQVREILACGAPALLAASGDRVGAGGVERQVVALSYRGQVVAARGWGGELRLFGVGARVSGREDRQHLALVDGVANRDLEAADDAVDLGRDLVLHLHRFEHNERLAGADRIVRPAGDRDHRARERGVQREVGHARRTLRDDGAEGGEDLLGRGIVAGVVRHVRPRDLAVGPNHQ